MKLPLTPGTLALPDLRRIWREPVQLQLDPASRAAIEASAATVAKVISEGRTVYGVNTGFGLLARKKILPDELELLQRSIVLSHAAGVGEPMSEAQVRLLLVLKINSLSLGFSGIRRSVIEALIQLLEREVYPLIPRKGSVGASGDLAPLAHMALVLMGEGEVLHRGQRMSGAEGLRIAGLAPITLAPKEGLALLNGTQASTAFALEGLFIAEDLFAAGVVAGALSVEAALGSRVPFDARIHEIRRQRGQIDVAAAYRHLLGAESEIGKVGQPVLIGGSMGTESWVLAGMASSEATAFSSACHGAGRSMSRTQARKRWHGRQVVDTLSARGITVRSPSPRGVAEEAPGAYKDVAQVVQASERAGLARRVARLVPVICIKG